MSIYMLRGGEKKTGFWLLPKVFNYKKNAVRFRNTYYPKLKIVKFVSVNGD